jgi:hypothetical protein
MDLLKLDRDTVERMIAKMLREHMSTWGQYTYFIVNEDTVVVKVYEHEEDYDNLGDLLFTIKAKLVNGKLEVVEVS